MPSKPTPSDQKNGTEPRKPAFTVPQVQASRRRDEEPPVDAAPPTAPDDAAPQPVADEAVASSPNGLVPSASLPGRPVNHATQDEDAPMAPLDSSMFAPPPAQPVYVRTKSDVIALRVDGPDAEWYRRITGVAAAHYQIPEGVLPRVVMAMIKENMHEIVRHAVNLSKGYDIGPETR